MSFVYIPTRFQWRQDTAANWAANNPTPLSAEPCLETDTGMWKLGDGTTPYNSLPYAPGPLANPGADRILFWDASEGKYRFLSLGPGLSISDTTLDTTGGGGGSLDPSLQIDRYEDWFRGRATSTATGTSFVTDNALSVVYLSASGGTATTNVDAAGQSYLSLATVTTFGAARAVLGNGAKIMVGGGEIRLTAAVRLSALSTPTDRVQLAIGLRDAITGTTKYLEAVYQDNINAGKWRLRSLDAAATDVDTPTAGPVANVYTTVTLVINAAGTSVELIVDGVSQGTLATNIPTAGLAFFVNFSKLAGSANRVCDLRYMRFQQTFTTPR